MSAYSRFVEAALSFQGAPYIWGGKCGFIFKDGKLQQHGFKDRDEKTVQIFDCSGLVTHCLFLTTIGKLDLRATHSAQTIFDTFPECPEDFGDGCLRLYPGHVAIDLGRGRVVDAHRGDSSCTTLLAALERDAKVVIHRDNRNNCLGYRKIPLDKSELKKV